jgi:GNAT superfamily N-acetyltransferase
MDPMGGDGSEARVATAADLDSVAETMARAFYNDPVWSWAFPEAERRLEQQRILWRFAISSALGHNWVWLSGDSAAAAALWIPPGEPELSPSDEERLTPMLEDLLGDGAARVLDTFERFDAAHPHGVPHFYLSLLGTHPDHRGKGRGMGLLADNLALIDEQRAAAFLESSNPVNDERYERLGFARCGEFQLGEGGPIVGQMWREPR